MQVLVDEAFVAVHVLIANVGGVTRAHLLVALLTVHVHHAKLALSGSSTGASTGGGRTLVGQRLLEILAALVGVVQWVSVVHLRGTVAIGNDIDLMSARAQYHHGDDDDENKNAADDSHDDDPYRYGGAAAGVAFSIAAFT